MIDRVNSKIIEYDTFKQNFDFIYLAGLKGLERACQIQEKSTSKIFDYVEMDIKEISYFDKFVDFCEELLSFNHPNILRLIYYSRVFVEETLGNAFCKFFLIFEYSESSVENEIQHLKKSGKRFKKSTMQKIVESIIAAMIFFHGRNIVHGDLRTIKIMKNEFGIYKIVPPRINPRQPLMKPPTQKDRYNSNQPQGKSTTAGGNRQLSLSKNKILQDLLPQQKEQIHFIKGFRPQVNKFSKSYSRLPKPMYQKQQQGSSKTTVPSVAQKKNEEEKKRQKEEFKKQQQIYEETFYYYSPEEYSSLNFRVASEKKKIDRFKAEMFTVGMVILHIGTFQSYANAYGKFSINEQTIKDGLKQLKDNYGYLISEITQRMLNMDPLERPSAKDVQALINDKDLITIDKDLSTKIQTGNGGKLTKDSTQEFDDEDESQPPTQKSIFGRQIFQRNAILKNKSQIVSQLPQLASSMSERQIVVQSQQSQSQQSSQKHINLKGVLPSLKEEGSPRLIEDSTPRNQQQKATIKISENNSNKSNQYFLNGQQKMNTNTNSNNDQASSKLQNTSSSLQSDSIQMNQDSPQLQQVLINQAKKKKSIFINQGNQDPILISNGQQQQQQLAPQQMQPRASIMRTGDHAKTQARLTRKESGVFGIGSLSKVLINMQKLQNEAEDDNENNDKIFKTLPQEYQDEIDSKVSSRLKDVEQRFNIEFLTNGNRYQGEKVDGRPYGWGTYWWSNGEIYEGHFVDGKYSGIGIYYWPIGEKYYGEFMNGEINGLGVRFYQNGIYFGQWYKGQNHGKGTFYWPNNAKFKGQFLKDKIYGKGTLILPDLHEQGEERCYEGLWKDELNKGISVEKFAFQSGKL